LIMGNSIGLGWSFTYTFILIECVVIVALASSFMLFTKKSKTN
jgi:hypothetical protein